MEVIYVDNHLFIAIKPAGLSTQPHDANEDNFLDRAKKWVKDKFKKPGSVFLEPIHRLDKQVSGLVLCARTSKALSRLQAQMREKKISKTYIGWIEGKPPSNEGTLEHYVCHEAHRGSIVPASHPEAKLAWLHYRLLLTEKEKSLLKITLETGRYHQIRLQMSAIGCPILGDTKYRSRFPFKKQEIALHHTEMRFFHPVTGEALCFEHAAPWVKKQ
jgi:23S rRNA pseudouridine1911/1915/1917 synthase